MYEILLSSSAKSSPAPTALTMGVVSSQTSRTMPLSFTRILGNVTFDVPGSVTISSGNTATTINITIPASATKLYFNLSVNPTGTAEPRINPSGTNTFVTEISSWGNLPSNLRMQFYNFKELVTVPEIAPPWNHWGEMFSGCSKFNSNISTWVTSHVLLMNNMFKGATSFNQNLNSWNVSNVTDMNDMFQGCSVFNNTISNWNVGNVTTILRMFSGCTIFDQNLSNLTFPKVTPSLRSSYDANTTAWQSVNKPNFAIK